MKFKYYFTIAKLLFIVSVPVILFILPGNYFDNGAAPTCLSILFFDVECYGCGLTRACQHLIHFEFEDAYAYNALSFIAFPALAIMWVQWFIKEWKMLNRLHPAPMPIDSIL